METTRVKGQRTITITSHDETGLQTKTLTSQLPSAPQKSMTHQSGREFYEKLISGHGLGDGTKLLHVLHMVRRYQAPPSYLNIYNIRFLLKGGRGVPHDRGFAALKQRLGDLNLTPSKACFHYP